ncbi:MAG: TIGR03016 family PEP-CTERM system-associated outer membrane protein [Pseudomonadota bacterium]
MVMEVMASTAKHSKRGLVLACLLLPGVGTAADWKFSPSLTVSEHYSDNVDLRADANAQSDWVTEITPKINIRKDGARLKVRVDYSLSGLVYAQGTNKDQIRHSLNAKANAELLEDWFYMDATSRMSHELASFSGGVGTGGGVAGNNNTTATRSYSLSPYMKHRFGSVATVEARVTRDGVFSGDSSVTDTESTRYLLSATSGTALAPFTWSLRYSRDDNDNSTVDNSGSEHGLVTGRLQLSQRWSLLGQTGFDKNKFTGASNLFQDYSYSGLGLGYVAGRRLSLDMYYNTSDNGNFVSSNVTFSPTLRTKVSASTTQKSFGRSHTLNLSHKARRSNWNLRYADEISTFQQQYQGFQGLVDLYDCNGNLVPYLPGDQPPASLGCTLIATGTLALPNTSVSLTYRAQNLSGLVSFTRPRHTWTLNFYDNTRQFLGSGLGSDDTTGFQATWAYRPNNRTTFSLSGGASQIEQSSSNRSDDLWNIGLNATRKFQPDLSGSLDLRHQQRDSNLASESYSENSLSARINMSF